MVMAKVDAEFLQKAIALEEKWSPRVGGPELEPVRQIIGFAISQLQRAGASLDDVDAYFSDVLAMLRTVQ